MTDKPDFESGTIQIPLEWLSTENLTTSYVNHVAVIHTLNEFYLVFGEMIPPMLFKGASPPKSIQIKPVARLAIAKQSMGPIAEAIIKAVDNKQGE